MVAQALTFGSGLFLYGLTIALSLLAGLGLLRLIRLPLRSFPAVFLAPVLTLAFWSIVLGLGVVLDRPVRHLTVVLGALSLGLALYGARGARALVRPDPAGPPPPKGVGWALALCVLLPVVVLFPYFRYGLAEYPGSTFPDGWSYVASGQHLWVYSREAGAGGGLPPLYQYATHLANTRFISGAMLGYFSPLIQSGDTEAAQGLFLAWSLFVFASSCAFFGLSVGLRPVLLVAYLVLTVASGWVCNLLHVNNFDNALALPYFPALVGAVVALGPRLWSWRIVLALLGAGLLYCYPEVAVFVFGGVFLIVLDRWRRERRDSGAWALTLGCAGALMLVLTAPYLPVALVFLRVQAISGLAPGVLRPGEGIFPGLLSARFQPSAFWALEGEYEQERFLFASNALGVLLSLLAGLGLLGLCRQRRLGLAVLILLLAAGAGVMILQQHYSYGAYKFILLGWWGVCLAPVAGLDALFPAGRPRARPFLVGSLAGVCVLGFGRVAAQQYQQGGFRPPVLMSQFRGVEQIGEVIGDAPVIVAVDDWIANEWAVYFLRDRPIDLASYRMYMAQAHVVPFMRQARVPPHGETPYVMTDDSFEGPAAGAEPWKLVWSGGPYRLWVPPSPAWALLNRNGNAAVQRREGQLLWRPDAGETTVEVVAGRAGVLRLGVTPLSGPDAAGAGPRDYLVSTDTDYREEITLNGDPRILLIPVRAGATNLTVRPLGPPPSRSARAGTIALDVRGVDASLAE